jgi:hypothetical protein
MAQLASWKQSLFLSQRRKAAKKTGTPYGFLGGLTSLRETDFGL